MTAGLYEMAEFRHFSNIRWFHNISYATYGWRCREVLSGDFSDIAGNSPGFPSGRNCTGDMDDSLA